MGQYVDMNKLINDCGILYPDLTKMQRVPVPKVQGIKEQNELNVKLANWLEENTEGVWSRSSKAHSEYMYYYFQHSIDAMFFKLSWGANDKTRL